VTAREILRREFGRSRNPITPTVLRRVKVRHPETGADGAAEVAIGNGIRMRDHEARGVMPRIGGVSVVWVDADGATRRASDEEHGSRTFMDEAPEREWWTSRGVAPAYLEALEYVRTLGARV
jgi:hypothetical protein